jgi:dinuclear metal center YbgI/SA1388 family protein
MKVKDITSFLDNAIPLSFQESYDNAGLQVGDPENDISSALITLDVTEEILEEAAGSGCGIIIAHHPLIFAPLKKLTGRTYQERIISKAIKENIAIYASHTNLDTYNYAVSRKMAEKISLQNIAVLSPAKEKVCKLVAFVPEDHIDKVRNAIFEAGAGVIGNYDRCSFNADGSGTYRAGEDTSPFRGAKGEFHTEREIRFETVFLSHLKSAVLEALMESHPYEEVAYDIYRLDNELYSSGLGCKGTLPQKVKTREFLELLVTVFGTGGIRYAGNTDAFIEKVALCGGSGAGLLGDAIRARCDAFVTGDIKYHDFFNTDGRLLFVDIGHYESEKFSIEILYELIIKKFPTFALRFSEKNTNPINYL